MNLLKNILTAIVVLVFIVIGALVSIAREIIGWIIAILYLILAWLVYGPDTLNRIRKRRAKR